MRLLLTRPARDSAAFARRLAPCAVECVVAPLFKIESEPAAAPDLDDVQAVALTSANGAHALAASTRRRDLAVMAVGPATAEAARRTGFHDVTACGGDVARLAATVSATLKPEDGRLLHVAGSAVAGDLAAMLAGAGFETRRFVAYRAEPIAVLPDRAAAALAEGKLDGVALFSPRAATLFDRLLRRAGLDATVARLTGYCLSGAVAERLPAPSWGALEVAPTPDGEALASLIRARAERE